MSEMQHSFLICGFPRSRTMWLSKFLTIPDLSVCTHEACEYAGSAEEFWKNAVDFCSDSGAQFYGNSDSANIYVLPSMLASNPLCRTVWVSRPMAEVAASMKAAKMPFDDKTAMTLKRFRDEHMEHLDFVIDYYALNSLAGCRSLWEYVLPGVPFDVVRWGYFADKKIGYTTDPGPRHTAKFMGWIREELCRTAA